jgi:hypothetical protein
MPMGYILQTRVYHVFIYLCKPYNMITNNFVYTTTSLNYNKVMCIIPTFTTRKTRKNDYGHMTGYDYRVQGSHVEPK